jgi:DNA-binding response OmpR family regulator
MTTILVAADAQWVRDQVRAAFVGPGQEVVEVTRGQAVREVFDDIEPELVILDMQIGNMGGVAVAHELRLEESAGRLDRARILLLLDREADEFIGRRADVDMMLVKPVDAGVLRRAAKRLLETVPPTSAADLDDESVRAGDESDDDVPVVDVG